LLRNGEADLTPGRYTQTAEAILSSDFPTMNARLGKVLDAMAAIEQGLRDPLPAT
jgi:hypothetical protein